jgi:hypothetical protein
MEGALADEDATSGFLDFDASGLGQALDADSNFHRAVTVRRMEAGLPEGAGSPDP